MSKLARSPVLVLASVVALVSAACGATPSAIPTVAPVATSTVAAAPTEEPTTKPTLSTATPAPTEAAATPTPPPPTALPTETPAPTAQYRLTFQATWSAATHPLDFPPNPHFSGLIGAAHSPAVRLWEEGGAASPGIKNMAETGEKSPLDSEIDALTTDGGACTTISGGGIGLSPGVVAVTFTLNLDCPVVSVVSMIAPSPDWFVGVSGLSLLENGAWAEQVVVELLPYDAGTDSGRSYTSANEPTASPETIRRIEWEPLLIDGVVPPLGTFTFTRLDG